MTTPENEIKKIHQSGRRRGNPFSDDDQSKIRKIDERTKKVLGSKTIYVSERIEKLANELDLFVKNLVEEAQSQYVPNQGKVRKSGKNKEKILGEINQSIPSLRMAIKDLPDYQKLVFNDLLNKLESISRKV